MILADHGKQRSQAVSFILTLVMAGWGWERSREPAVVARNGRGESRRLFWVHSPEEAEEKAARIAKELHELGLAEWCDRYHVPIEWASE